LIGFASEIDFIMHDKACLPVEGEAGQENFVMDKENQPAGNSNHSLLTRERKIAGVAWIFVIIAYGWYTRANDLTTIELTRKVIEWLAANPLGFFLYVILYMIRPLFLFPATFVTMAAGYLYGPATGIFYAIIASNLSSLVAYYIGRYFGSELIDQFSKYDLVNRYAQRLRKNSFETALTLRFLFLPYDLVSYFSGFLKISWRGFILATILGSIPGTISFGLIGAALDGDFTAPTEAININLLIASAVMFALSIAFSRWFRTREIRTLN
jgi:uncharacterized membrane protein YdjX (TVP38/TMEM64 family)